MALDRARGHYVTALRALDALPQLTRPLQLRWCAIGQKLGQTCVFDPLDVGDNLPLFERAASLAHQTGDLNVLARAEYWLAYVNYGRGRPRDAVRHSENALKHALASDDQKLVAQVEATLGQSLASAGRYERALPLLAHAVESKRQYARVGSGTAIGSAYTLARTGYTLGDLGRFDEAHAAFDESLRFLGDKVHSVGASVRELVCAVHLWQGRWAEARNIGLEGAELALRCRSRYLTAMGRALGSCGGWALDGDPAALQVLRESTQWMEERGGAVSTSLGYGWLVEATVKLGLAAEARRHAARLFVRARLQDRHGEAMGCRALARLAARQGELDRVLHYLARADAAANLRGSRRELAVNTLARAELAECSSDAKALAETAAQEFEAMKMAWHLERAGEVLAGL
jgi:tetratricopeptide (TPR) repeat protein